MTLRRSELTAIIPRWSRRRNAGRETPASKRGLGTPAWRAALKVGAIAPTLADG